MKGRYAFIERYKEGIQEVEFNSEIANYTLENKLAKLLNPGDSYHIFYSEKNANRFRDFLYQTRDNEKIILF